MRYYRFFFSQPSLLPDALRAFLDERGIRSPASAVRSRACVLLLRFVKQTLKSSSAAILEAAAKAGVPAVQLGTVTAEAALKIAAGPSISVADLRSAHESWFPAFMSGEL